MSLLTTLKIEGNGRETVLLKNHRTGQQNQLTFIAVGDFSGGEVAVQISPNGTDWVDNVRGGLPVTFTEGVADNILSNSDEIYPVSVGFNMTGAGTPDLEIFIYDNK